MERYENWIKALFSEEELCELLEILEEERELSPLQIDILIVLLHNTPKTLVHCEYSG